MILNFENFIKEHVNEGLQEEYKTYFKALLKDYGVDSPSELDAENKTKFFNDVKAGWEKGVGKR